MFNTLRSRNDPILQARQRLRATWSVGAAATTVIAWWALTPLRLPVVAGVTLAPPMDAAATEVSGVEPIDQSVFSARLWDTPPQPDAAGPKGSEPTDGPEPRFQLVGITKDDDRLYAVLYDPDADRLLTVKDGDRIRHHTVTAISESEVELSDGRSTRRLALREGRS